MLIDKEIKGKTTLILYFFDYKERSLVMFEKVLPGNLKEQLKDIQYDNLKEAKTDTWAHKIVKGTVVKNNDYQPFLAEDQDSASRTVVYWTAWGDNTHYTKAIAHAHTSSNIYAQGYINSTLTLEQWIIPGGETYKEYGWSNIEVGLEKTVENTWTLYAGQTGSRDIISKQEYGGQ